MRRFSRTACALAATLLASSACAGSFGVVTVGASGLGGNCSTASLQQAIQLAKGPNYDDVIWVTRDVANGVYPVGTLNIQDQDVEIIGGFDSCTSLTPSGRQTLSGAGGQSNSVFTIRGNSNVILRNLDIADGDDGINDDGGGIDFKGQGSLTLSNVVLSNNIAGYGGAMLVRGSGGPLIVNLLDFVLISNNFAYYNGGGIHASGDTQLNIIGNGVTFLSNRALAVDNGTGNGRQEGYGGGLYITPPAYADIRARGISLIGELPVFYGNQARYGGAIALRGTSASTGNVDGVVRLSSYNGSAPLVLQGNSAERQGGAIFSRTYSSNSGFSYVQVCAYDVALRENSAADGPAIYSGGDTSLSGQQIDGPLLVNNNSLLCYGRNQQLPRPPPVTRCGDGVICTEVSRNAAVDPLNQPTQGATIEVSGENAGAIELNRIVFKQNTGGSVIHVGDTQTTASLRILNSLFARNDVTATVIDSDSNRTEIRQCTIVDNNIGADHVLRIVESGASGVSSRSTISNSIIAQPGKLSLDLRGAAEQTLVRHVLASEVATLRGDESVFIGDAQFVSPTVFDYRPGAFSMAIDFAPTTLDGAIDNLGRDVQNLTRTVDLGNRADIYGPRDLGAYELQVAPADPIFRDGIGDPLPPE
jgi:predicted outer membrane repeat protein